MKALTVLFTLAANVVMGQAPVLTPDYAYATSGTLINRISISNGSFATPQAGENITWDYSTLPTNIANTDTANIIPVAQLPAPYNTQYPPNATFATIFSYSSTNYVDYFKKTPDSLLRVQSDFNGQVYTYTYGVAEALFPMQYNESVTHDYTSVHGITTVNYHQQITYLGYGTLILPAGSIPGAICLKIEFTDDFHTNPTSHSYAWYKPGFAFLLRANVGQTGYNADFTNSILASTNEIGVDLGLTLFPNPVTDKININVKAANYTTKIYNASGQLMLPSYVGNTNNQTYELDIAALPPGLYTVAIVDNLGHVAAKRFVK